MPLSKIVAKSITDDTITTDQIADTSVHGRRNIVQNGSYTVNQRGNISSSATTISANTYIIDRWYLRKQNTGSHSVTVLEDQTVTGLTGLHNVLKITEFHDSAWLGNFIEIAAHPFLSGQQVTVSYYAKADSAISTFKVFLHDNNDGGSHGNPYFTQTGTISTSWQRYSHTMTMGTLANDNAAGYLNLGFGQTDTDTAFYITGVQLEIGSKATPLEHRSFGDELQMCRRYYEQYSADSGRWIAAGGYSSTTRAEYTLMFNVQKRATPTVSFTGTSSDFLLKRFGTSNAAGGTLSANNTGPDMVKIDSASNPSTHQTGQATLFGVYQTAKVIIDAEL